MGEKRAARLRADFRRKEELGVDVSSLNMWDIWVEMLSRQLDLHPVTESKTGVLLAQGQ